VSVPASAAPLPRPRRSFVDLVWRAFASPRTSELLLLALASGWGLGALSNREHLSLRALRDANGHEWWFPAYRLFELDRPFRSWWLLLLVALLALSLAALAMERVPRIPGRWARLAAWTACLSLCPILSGALLTRLRAVDGLASIPMDGGTFDYVYRRTAGGSPFKQPLGFAMRVEAARAEKAANGKPKAFETDLALLDASGGVVRRQTVKEGTPLVHAGWTFAQKDFEEEPGQALAKLAVTDLTKGGAAKQYSLGKDGEAAMPDGVKFRVENYSTDFEQLGPAVQLMRTAPGGAKTSFWVFEKYPEFDAKNRGDKYGLRFDGVDPFYFTNLRVTRDPGYPVWLAGGCLLLAALVAFPVLRKAGV
jgi:cytochrome c biogenesis protein ResB